MTSKLLTNGSLVMEKDTSLVLDKKSVAFQLLNEDVDQLVSEFKDTKTMIELKIKESENLQGVLKNRHSSQASRKQSNASGTKFSGQELADDDSSSCASYGSSELSEQYETESARRRRIEEEVMANHRRTVNTKYTQNIDNVYKKSKDDTERFIKRLKNMIAKDPERFEADGRNLKSFVDDLDELEEQRQARKSYSMEQQPQHA